MERPGFPATGIRTAAASGACYKEAAGVRVLIKRARWAGPKSAWLRRRRAGSPAMPSLEDDEDAKAVKQDAGDIPPIVQKVTIA